MPPINDPQNPSAVLEPRRVGAYLGGTASGVLTPREQRERIIQRAQRGGPDGSPWRLVTEYTDPGDGSARRRMLQDVRDGKLDLVVVASLDLIVHSPAEFADLWAQFQGRGAHLVSLEELLETDSPTGQSSLRLALSLAALGREAPARTAPAQPLPPLPVGASSRADFVGEEGLKPEVSEEDRAELEALLNEREAAIGGARLEVILSQEDFPVVVLTDTSSGDFIFDVWDEQRYRQVLASAAPPIPNARYAQDNRHCVFLTPTMAVCTQTDSFHFPDGKVEWKTANLFVKRPGGWKTKAIMESGIGKALEKAGLWPPMRGE